MKKIFLTIAVLLYALSFAQNDTIKTPTEREDDIEEVIINSTRTSRTIANTPTRVETIELEEIDEKSNMRPSNVAMILHESTGIAVQQTSATSANSSIRIQGLDGRYTQILKDGFPSFGNFANGLSILEIPPLDLKQVEIIKGPSSTLFGAGAIAGVINFISRTPREKQDLNILTNYANTGLLNFGVYASKKTNNFGYTFMATYNNQKAFDVDGNDFSELPQSKDFTIHPKLFFYLGGDAKMILGNAFTKGNRLGGDMQYIGGGRSANHPYFEENNTIRNTTTLEFEKKFTDNSSLNFKSAYSIFDRKIKIPGYNFKGENQNFYSDLSWNQSFPNQTLILGGNYIADEFRQSSANPFDLNLQTETSGVYAQHTWDIADFLKVENGIRTDFVNYNNALYDKGEIFFLPKTSFLFLISPQLTSRVGGGFGYKTPTSFTEQTDTFSYQNLRALQNVTSEKSLGATADLNFKTRLGDDFNLSLNQMFFYTKLTNSIILNENIDSTFNLMNTSFPVFSKGFETNLKFIYKDFIKLFAGYTFTDTKADYLPDNQMLPLVPKSKVNLALIAEKEGNYKAGFEAYYTDKQILYNRQNTNPYWELGFMVEKFFGRFSIFLNLENFTDTKQINYKPVVSGTHQNPQFDEIWTHVEGRTINSGIKFKL
ncbi:TonB-dependent receptor [Chryseobacterium sp. SNU WT5]|uniref:TonB-dependent receptor plug domain-containing protein n=1 Tax=Chryseobacterium sp. SNU WT5 TaxID=2594269 RepID=UPI00117ED8D8|nr:TonB-dependent receptor plug domain-containing protein [Chryseobacterium sp. SNU WT5]QDP84719.1 TonB-dependent receptor [Chryseobacterium sp. SNU WT5]